MNKSFLLIQKLSKSFKDGNEKITVLKNINFSFEDNKIISLTGPSGSGKSTLLHLLALLENPDSGKMIFNTFGYFTNLNLMTRFHTHVCQNLLLLKNILCSLKKVLEKCHSRIFMLWEF